MTSVRHGARALLPRPLWVLLRRVWSYARRLGHWGLIMIQLRGDSVSDTAKLWLSAIAAPLTALPDLDRWRNPQLLFDARIRVAGSGRFLCRRGTDDLWHVLPAAQRALHRALAEVLAPGGVFVDAGANIGAFTLPAARLVGPEGRVVAIEMMPETVLRLRDHARDNGLTNIRVVDAALADAGGHEVIARVPARRAGQASIVRQDFGPGALSEQRVRTVTLDEVTAGLERIDLMKVDLEGAEALAFAGGRDALARTRCLIFEQWPGQADTRSADIARAAGFSLSWLDGSNVIGRR